MEQTGECPPLSTDKGEKNNGFPVDLCGQAEGLASFIVLRSLCTHCHSNRNSPNNSSELLMLT